MRLKFLTPPAPILCLGMKMLGEAPVTFLAALTEVTLYTLVYDVLEIRRE